VAVPADRGLKRNRIVAMVTLEQGEISTRQSEPVECGEQAGRRDCGAAEQPNPGEVDPLCCRIRCQTNAALIHRGSRKKPPRE
jgi:hypothetical protein